VSLAGVDGVGDRQVIDNPLLPVLLGPLLPGQAVIEAGQAGALKGGHPQDVLEEDSTAGGRETPQRMTCTRRDTVIMCWTSLGKRKRKDYAFQRQINEKPNVILGCPLTSLDLLGIFVLEFV